MLVAAPRPVAVAPAPTAAPKPVVLTPDGKGVDPQTAQTIADVVQELQNQAPEAPSAADLAAAQDARELHGIWNVRHTVGRTNGQNGSPSPPLMPTSWEFTPGGALLIRGGNSIDMRYTYTGNDIVVTGLGPRQDYHVDRLTATELRVTTVIVATPSFRMENTTVLDRANRRRELRRSSRAAE